jgi:hypothetical protein
MNGFIYSLYTPQVIICNYSAIVGFTLYNSLLQIHLSSPGNTKRRNCNSLTESHTPSIIHEWNLLITHQVFTGRRTFRGYLLPRTQNYFTSLNFTSLNWTVAPFVFKITPLYGPHGKHRLPCLPTRCLATDFLYLRAFARRGLNRKQSQLLHLFVFTELFIEPFLRNALSKSVSICWEECE